MKRLLLLLCSAMLWQLTAQEMPISYDFGEKFSDRYKYSNLQLIQEDGAGGDILVRSYVQGLILKPRGYFIEHYDKDLNLVSEYNYKLRGLQFVDGFLKDGQLNLLFLNYDFDREQYEYWVHQSNTINYDFKAQKLLSVKTKAVPGALGKNYYNRNFSKGFTTTVLFDQNKSGFVISTHLKKNKVSEHRIHHFDARLNKLGEYDFSQEAEEKNYAFENLAFSKSGTVYLVGKAYFKKKRFKVDERKFQYEIVRLSDAGITSQNVDDPGKYSESLYPIVQNDRLVCVGFYANRKDHRYNGLSFFELDPNSLSIRTKKYNAFSEQFMQDKFGREEDKEIKNLVFKEVHVTPNNDILFNAEEYFVTHSMQDSGAGQRIKIERFHHNDIVSAKLDAQGQMVWARNINKAEVTQGDGAYASYSAFCKEGKTYFFICTAAENPQLINNERLIFKQGLSRNRNVFVISLDENGKMAFEKIIDDKDARLPLMVSKPLKLPEDENMLFYAKRGSKKQLVKVAFN